VKLDADEYLDFLLSRHTIFVIYEYNNNTNNNYDHIYSAVIYSASHMWEFTLVPLGESRSAPGGSQLVGQAANFTFWVRL